MSLGERWKSREDGTELQLVSWPGLRVDRGCEESGGTAVEMRVFGRGVVWVMSYAEAMQVGMKLIELGTAAKRMGELRSENGELKTKQRQPSVPGGDNE